MLAVKINDAFLFNYFHFDMFIDTFLKAEASNGEEPKDIEKENDLNEEKVQEKDVEKAKDIEEIKKEKVTTEVEKGDKPVETKRKKRLHSLDTLRG